MQATIQALVKHDSNTQTDGANVREMRLDRWLLALLLLIALILRLYTLTSRSFWADELDQILYGKGDLAFTLGSSTPPLDYLITHFVVHYLGASEFIVRLPDVIWGVLTVFFVYRLGRYWFDRPVAYLAGFMLAIMPMHIQYSQMARYYSLPTLLFLLCLFTCTRALDKRTKWAWLIYGLISLLALFTHVYAVPVLGLIGLWVLLIKRPPFRTLLTFAVITGIPFVLFVLWFISKRDVYLYTRDTWVTPYPLTVVDAPFFDLSLYFKMAVAHPEQESTIQVLFDSVTVSLWVAALLWPLPVYALYLTIQQLGSIEFRRSLTGLLFLAFGGMAATLAIHLITRYFFDPRQFVFYLPFICLIIAATYLYLIRNGKFSILKRVPRRHLIPGSAVLLVFLSLLIFWRPLMNVYNAPVQDWRGLAQMLVKTMGPDDVLISPFTEYLAVYEPRLIAESPPDMIEDVNGFWVRGYPTHMPETVDAITAVAQKHSQLWIILLGGVSFQRPQALMDFIAANHLTSQSYSEDIEIYRYPQPGS